MEICDRCKLESSILDLCSIELSVSEHPHLCDTCWRAVRDFAYGQGRVEEKKAAFLKAALELGARLTTDWVQSGDVRATVAFMAAYRALVESESASKKEDAP